METSVYFFVFAAVVHLLFLVYGEWQDKHFNVKYTDVDYFVFTDAAKYVVQGSSPFSRHTYRYTPLLAYLMVPNILVHEAFGKILFSVFNVATGFVIFKICKLFSTKDSNLMFYASTWIFNPVTITVSTRGNAESLMTFLVLSTVYFMYSRKYFLSGIFYGFSVHFKLYPVVYALPLFLHLSFRSSKQISLKNLCRNVFLPNRNLRVFVLSAFLSFVIPTAISFWKYPNEYYNEALIYHLSRKDVRHNFSPYCYLLYLTDNWNNNAIGLLLFLPQLALFILFAIKYSYGNDLMFCLFCETFIFVMLNKVCTSQYFLWFLCFVSLLIPYFKMSTKRGIALLLAWFFGQAVWLYFAYQLEFLGKNVFLLLWGAALFFYTTNCTVLCQLIKYYSQPKHKKR